MVRAAVEDSGLVEAFSVGTLSDGRTEGDARGEAAFVSVRLGL